MGICSAMTPVITKVSYPASLSDSPPPFPLWLEMLDYHIAWALHQTVLKVMFAEWMNVFPSATRCKFSWQELEAWDKYKELKHAQFLHCMHQETSCLSYLTAIHLKSLKTVVKFWTLLENLFRMLKNLASPTLSVICIHRKRCAECRLDFGQME